MFIPLHQLNSCALAGRKALYPRRARQAIKAAIKITSRTNSDAGHMAASLTRTNRTSSQLPALWGSVLLSSAFFALFALFYPSALSCHIFFSVHNSCRRFLMANSLRLLFPVAAQQDEALLRADRDPSCVSEFPLCSLFPTVRHLSVKVLAHDPSCADKPPSLGPLFLFKQASGLCPVISSEL